MLNHQETINQLKQQIDDLKKRWPAHSVSPAMFQELEDLEDELAQALVDQEKENAQKDCLN